MFLRVRRQSRKGLSLPPPDLHEEGGVSEERQDSGEVVMESLKVGRGSVTADDRVVVVMD